VARIREIHLWGDGFHLDDYLSKSASYLERRLSGTAIILEGNFWSRSEKTGYFEDIAERIAGARVFDLDSPHPAGGNEPMRGEISYEQGRIEGQSSSPGILYDGFFLSSIFRTKSGIEGGRLDSLQIVLTDRLIGTFDRSDRRYHARAVVFGYPSIVSITGIVEAPARPREYYMIKRQYQAIGMIPPELDEQFKGRYLEHGDKRIGEALKGYLMQCFFYQTTGDPFCSEKECRLFNAHWQEELINSQIKSTIELCPRHEEMLASFSDASTGKG
jgi:hypothetical protein